MNIYPVAFVVIIAFMLVSLLGVASNVPSGEFRLPLKSPTATCGDVNAQGDPPVDIDDVIYLINYIFTGGPAPLCNPINDCSDVNRNGFVDIDDVIYLVDYIFIGGPAPCSPDKTTTVSHSDWTRQDVESYVRQIGGCLTPGCASSASK